MTPQQLPRQGQVQQQPDPVEKVYDIGMGRYDVAVSVGPSYQSKRQEAAATVLELLKVLPTAAPFISDLMVRNMDIPGAKEIADRLAKMLPPQLQDDNDPAAQIQQLQSQHQQMTQALQECTQQLQEAKQDLAMKKYESDAKIAISKMQEETKIAVAEITTKAQDARMRAQFEQDVWTETHSAAHETALQAVDHGQEQNLASRAQEAQSQQQIQGQVHEQGMAQQAQEAQPSE